MHPVARASDFGRLPTDLQSAHLEVLLVCQKNHLSCRCEMNGNDFTITIGRGLSSPKYWLDQFQYVPEHSAT